MPNLKQIVGRADQAAIALVLDQRMIAGFLRHGMSSLLASRLLDVFSMMLSDRPEAALREAADAMQATAHAEGAQEMTLRALSRAGLLYDLAGLTARANTIAWSIEKAAEEGGIAEEGGPRETVAAMPGVAEALHYLGLPVFEAVMTAHPTNVNALDSVRALRRLGLAMDAVRAGDDADDAEAEFDRAMDNFITAPVLPEATLPDGTRVPGKLGVHDETRFVLRTMANVYRDLSLVYQAFEEPLAELAAKTGEDFDPLALRLQQRFSSWGSSGDKDGNSQVNADTTLEAVALHRDTIYALYSRDLTELSTALHPRRPLAAIAFERWSERIGKSRRLLQGVLRELAEAHRAGIMLPPERFDQCVARIHQTGLDCDTLLAELEALAHDTTAGAEPRRLATHFYRGLRNFRDHFARIEYRETSLEYSRSVGAILHAALASEALPTDAARLLAPLRRTSYLSLPEPARLKLLTAVLEAELAPLLLGIAWPRIEAEGQGRAYDPEDAMPIAYQTMRRMELARDFPAMITANVLAECTGAGPMLEAQFLQEASRNEVGERAVMGIVPLFEAPEVMDAIGSILRSAYTNPAYRRHLETVAAKIGSLGMSEGRKTQQVQFAHSDNTRRAGIPAARARIYRGHEVVQALGREFGIVTEEFHGNGQSDSLRGGVRSISAMTNMFGSHRFMKFTYQGGDLVNYFNDPKSIERLYTRNFSHAAKVLRESGDQAALPDYDASHGKNLAGYNAVAVEALSATWEDYRRNVFEQEAIGFFLARTRDDHGNVSSRASSRGKAGAKRKGQPYIDATQARTITFSESFQHAGIVPTFLGSLTLEECLRRALTALAVAQGEDERAPFVTARIALGEIETAHASDDSLRVPTKAAAPIDPAIFRHFYYKSAVFRDVIDRLAFGLAMTDLDAAPLYNPLLVGDAFLESRLKPEYRVAARLVIESMPPDLEGASPDPATAGFTELRDRIRGLLPHLEEAMRHKTRYMHVIQSLKRDWLPLDAAHHGWILALAHACNNSVTYGRFLTADDPKYSAMIHPPRRLPLPFGVLVGEERRARTG